MAELGRLLALVPAPAPAQLRGDCLLQIARLRFESLDGQDALVAAQGAWREGMVEARRSGDPLRVVHGCWIYTRALPVTGDVSGALASVTEAFGLAEELGHVRWMARFEALRGMLHHQREEYDEALACGQRALGRALRAGDRRALVSAGALLHPLPADLRGDLPLLPGLEALEAVAADLGDIEMRAVLQGMLAGRRALEGDLAGAAGWLVRRFEVLAGSRTWRGHAYTLMLLAQLAGLSGDLPRAAWLHGMVAARLELLRAGMPPAAAATYDGIIAEVRAGLGESFVEEARCGSLLAWNEALALGLRYARALAGRPQADPAPFGLTPRELQVLRLLATGLSNPDIAARLGLTAKTVMHHSSAIYRKLGVRSRTEAAAVAVTEGVLDRVARG